MAEYPKTLYANVLLLDGNIINWKTGDRSWEGGNWINNRQPLSIVVECATGDPERLQSETFSAVVYNDDQNQLFFADTSKEFYKMFELSERYGSGFRPY